MRHPDEMLARPEERDDLRGGRAAATRCSTESRLPRDTPPCRRRTWRARPSFSTSSAGTRMMSWSSTTKSASLPGVSEPMSLLLERGVRRPERHAAQRFLARHPLLRIPAAGRPVVAHPGARTAAWNGDERIHLLHREVAAVRDDRRRCRAASATHRRLTSASSPAACRPSTCRSSGGSPAWME